MKNFKFITFATDNYVKPRMRLVDELSNSGVKNIKVYGKEDISNEFLMENYKIFKYRRGYGYWIWKPFLILKSLLESDENDVIIYIDSTDLPKDSFYSFINDHFKDNDYLLFNNLRHESHDVWTKKDCFVLMDCDTEKFHNQVQLEAGVLGFRKTKFNIDLIKEWLYYCKNENIVTDLPNTCGLSNHKNFIEHRHDQSILTNLSIKYNLKKNESSNDLVEYNNGILQKMIYN